ncbi:hypothetical protein LTR62_000266 [Meristemomyces frigidus]|uniref:Extracellular membrane protein CFEM domain-containing protein n=1 Tax=Meristemomyces frigidus TaxID=1508187 RepID=A0AAN7TJB6_9PEZI|nr:hypothetical protein LTR62_000266 [Meristemomyces frigidus]
MRSVLALLALPTASLAVSLVDFPPRVSGLTSACQAVYTQQIVGCSQSDFSAPASCSVGCIQAMQAMTNPVQQACSHDTNIGGTVINAFLHNAGTQAICGNAASVLATMGTPSTTSMAQTSSAAVVSTTSAASSMVPSSAPQVTTSTADSTDSSSDTSTATDSRSTTISSSSIILTGTSTASAIMISTTATQAATSSGMLVDTSSSPSASKTNAATTSNPQTSADNPNHGGSPFDSQGNLANAGNAVEVLSYGAVAICGLLFAMVWL